MVIALLALLLAGEDTGAATPGPVEVEIAVNGSADIPAQGYRVSAFFSPDEVGDGAAAKVKAAKAAAVSAVRPLGPVETAVCAPDPARLGFVGNESVGGPDPQEGPQAFALPLFETYEAVLPNRQSAERAVAAIRQSGARNVQGPEAVLFDCAAGVRSAQADALVQARAQAEPYARLLGLRIAGVRRISQASTRGTIEGYMAALDSASMKVDSDKVRVSVPVTVTFALEK